MENFTGFLKTEWPHLVADFIFLAIGYFGAMAFKNRVPQEVEIATPQEMARNDRIAGLATVAFFTLPVVYLMLRITK